MAEINVNCFQMEALSNSKAKGQVSLIQNKLVIGGTTICELNKQQQNALRDELALMSKKIVFRTDKYFYKIKGETNGNY